MIRCAQMAVPFYSVPSSSGSKVYRVVLFKPNQLPSCTCTGFMTKRNKNANLAGGGYEGAGKGLANKVTAWCRHLEQVSKQTCQWQLPDHVDALPPSRCPRCGGPVVSDSGKVVNVPDVPDVAATTTGLVGMMRDLAGCPSKPVESEPEQEAPEPAGVSDFDADTAVAELAAMLSSTNPKNKELD